MLFTESWYLAPLRKYLGLKMRRFPIYIGKWGSKSAKIIQLKSSLKMSKTISEAKDLKVSHYQLVY